MYRFDSVYRVNNNDDLGSPSYWNTRFQDIDVRVNSVENATLAAQIQGAVDLVTQAGIARINDTITPLVNNITANVNALQSDVTALQNLVVSDQNNIISQMNSLLAQAQSIVSNLEALGTIQDGTF